jgi:hypothetical protein
MNDLGFSLRAEVMQMIGPSEFKFNVLLKYATIVKTACKCHTPKRLTQCQPRSMNELHHQNMERISTKDQYRHDITKDPLCPSPEVQTASFDATPEDRPRIGKDASSQR